MSISCPSPLAPQRLRLTELPVGRKGRVCQLEGRLEVCQRLRELGLVESVLVERLSGQRTLLCRVYGARLALSDQAAAHVVVEMVRRED